MREAEPSPEMLATLDAVEATLAGEPVDPAFAEIAELALLIRAERPAPTQEFGHELDDRVARRFDKSVPGAVQPRRRRSWWWTLAPAGGLAVAAIVAVVVVSSGGGASSGVSMSSSSGAAARGGVRHPPGNLSLAAPLLGHAKQSLTPSPGLRVPNARGRKLTQSSQLTLGVPGKRIETVAQEIYNMVGEQNGFVDSSQVTAAGSGGYAHLQLSVPSITLPQTMSALSTLSYAKVLQRTDTVEDITSQYRNAVRHHDKKKIKALKREVAYSQVMVNIQSEAPPPPVRHRPHASAFIPRAAHTALHVLTVIAGVSLIVLAVLVPLALVAALLWWIADALRRRRRERALDTA